jgi:hypothetical protein
MTAQVATEATDLRQRIARALHRYDNEHALSGNDIPSEHHYGEADAVVDVVRSEIDRLHERLRLLTNEKVAEVVGPTIDLLCAELKQARAEVAAAREYAEAMRNFCSPHGVSVHYAEQLVQAMDRAKEDQA